MKLRIVDGRFAHVPLRADPDTRSSLLQGLIIVHQSPLLTSLQEHFELLCERGLPIPGTPPQDSTSHELDATDRAILTRLSSGQKDEAIARHLGLADRTVGRRVALMMRAAGVTTRFQLGEQAILRGWLR